MIGEAQAAQEAAVVEEEEAVVAVVVEAVAVEAGGGGGGGGAEVVAEVEAVAVAEEAVAGWQEAEEARPPRNCRNPYRAPTSSSPC